MPSRVDHSKAFLDLGPWAVAQVKGRMRKVKSSSSNSSARGGGLLGACLGQYAKAIPYKPVRFGEECTNNLYQVAMRNICAFIFIN